MSYLNPYDLLKKTQEMPDSLRQELKEDDQNTSIDKKTIEDGRGPLLDAYVDNRLRADKPITFLGFIDDLRQLWVAAGKKGEIIRKRPLKRDSVSPVITYRLKKRTINDQFKDIKPRYRGTVKHPYIPGEWVKMFGQMFDLLVEFSIYSRSAEEADELVIEFEEFLQLYAGYFKKNGVQEILFKEQGEDDVVEEQRVDTPTRSLLYVIRFEKIIIRLLNDIQQISVQANIHSEEQN
ncbi:hypothetical protein B14_200215 (plasmid) [Bacillus licheniformis]|uniref:hypothetical protein n=1 Tax=Bacillus licheniformis TaxID=1402 RepID=UPI0009B7C686|nr:hypothetical protein [Bacillus licheniformis]ARC67426.1 hypothetical protein B14_200215 [Bacillus licheniformis]ARW46165.1 hypothetical protein S100141_04947 [Bacillus licheniformis]MDE1421856.1 hypothetical protein [Bacillus licheniformis]MEC0475861.1 hypothetical protein [Bacillus licheniformis]RHL11921.1 hypothetical protein DW032_20035 [Bacillus licheniformis]